MAGRADVVSAWATILLSWLFRHIVFSPSTMRTNITAKDSDGQIGGFDFPTIASPDYGISLLLACHRDDIAGIGRGHYQQSHSAHRHGPRRSVVLLQVSCAWR